LTNGRAFDIITSSRGTQKEREDNKMFKMFAKRETKKTYRVTVMNLDTKDTEVVITDSEGFTGLVLAGYEIIEAEEI
jgi:hypothetical protein